MTSSAHSPALLLAFDTSTGDGSVAVARGEAVLAGVALGQRAEHAARLVPAIGRALDDAGVDRRDLSGIVVGEGPGSFTGVRVAAATAKGLARALGIPLWSVSSLGATALARGAGEVRYALFDARSDRVYGACYSLEEGRVSTVVAPWAGTMSELLAEPVPDGAVFVGDGAERHRRLLESAGYPIAEPTRDGAGSLAEGVLRLFHGDPLVERVEDPGSWEPAYLRGSVATPA